MGLRTNIYDLSGLVQPSSGNPSAELLLFSLQWSVVGGSECAVAIRADSAASLDARSSCLLMACCLWLGVAQLHLQADAPVPTLQLRWLFAALSSTISMFPGIELCSACISTEVAQPAVRNRNSRKLYSCSSTGSCTAAEVEAHEGDLLGEAFNPFSLPPGEQAPPASENACYTLGQPPALGPLA